MNCERITSAVCHAVKKEVNSPLVAYIDDMGGPAPNNFKAAQERYEGVCSTVVKMGLDLALDKCQGPTRFMTWTGTSFDTVKMVMSIEESKIVETLDLAVSFLDRCDISLREMEVLIGKLQHAIKFCPHGRRFMNRILGMRRLMNEMDRYELTSGAKEDLQWYIHFLKRFNGSAIIRSQFVASEFILVDACLVGGGALWKDNGFTRFKWPASIKTLDLCINDLELFNLLISLRVWGELLRGTTVKILCDNNTSVKAMLSGKARNDFMSACLRELWLITSTCDIFILCEHIRGEDNNEADTLSRAFLSERHWSAYVTLENDLNVKMFEVSTTEFRYPDS